MGVDLEIDVDLWPVVELAHRFCIALAAVNLSVDLVVHVGEPWETVGPVLADDVGLDGVSARIGEIDDGADDRIILLVQHLAR